MPGLGPLLRYADFDGRSGRKEYWEWWIFVFGGLWLLQRLKATALNPFGAGSSLLISSFLWAIVIPTISVSFRRLHDRGRSGWLFTAVASGGIVLAVLANGARVFMRVGDEGPLGVAVGFGAFWVAACCYLLFVAAQPGDPAANQYGPPGGESANTPMVMAPRADQPELHASGNEDAIDALERLAQLKARGVLSDEEFDEQKRRLLGQP